ncbi:MAG: alpha-beta hydrolase superfamily lysophospholipase [Halieaceae bacterium]|jgi:alpha-beta hydrolase superfamily lysophospholipase
MRAANVNDVRSELAGPGQEWRDLDLDQLRQSLVQLDLAVSAGLTKEQSRFCALYSINFEERLTGVDHALGYCQSGDYRLAIHVFQCRAASGNLLLLHGLYDHSGLYRHLIEYGLQRNMNVVIFDMPGHGLSTGEPFGIESFGDYRHAIADVLRACDFLSGSWSVLAQSNGAAALIEYTLTSGLKPFDRVVLLAPLIRPRGWWWIRAGHVLLHRLLDTVPRSLSTSSSDPEFLRFLHQDPLQIPTTAVSWVGALRRWLAHIEGCVSIESDWMLIQGTDDSTVDWQYNIPHIQKLFPGSRVEYIEGARHQLANESTTIRQRCLHLVSEYLDAGGATADD